MKWHHWIIFTIALKFTEAGMDTTNVEKELFETIYDRLNKIKIGNETTMSCEDTTTIYSFTLVDDTKIAIAIECDWVIINGKRYILE